MICDEVSGFGPHEIQLHALNVVTDSWSSFVYTTLKHPTGLIVPDEPIEQGGFVSGVFLP